MSAGVWYALVGTEVLGPFDILDRWYHEHAGPDWRHRVHMETGTDPWRVDYTELPDGRYVSTVFLALDHRMFGEGPPLVFETMCYPDGEHDGRCSTWGKAVMMHEAAVMEMRLKQ